MNFRVLILGSNSAIPAFGRFPSAQIIQHFGDLFLVDCGEGVQFNLSLYKVKRSKIKAIFISHLHGDHIFGLPGFLTSLSLSGHQHALEIYGPKGIKVFIDTILEVSESLLRFPLHVHEVSGDGGKLFETEKVEVIAFPLKHRITTFGYLFREKPKKNRINGDLISQFGLSTSQIAALMQGNAIRLANGQEIDITHLEEPPSHSLSYAYCSDTVFDPSIIPHIQGVNLLYHEATFSDAMSHLAQERYHTTSLEAGRMAKLANVDKLIIGHFSSRYHDLIPLLQEAQSQFPNTLLAQEGIWFDVV
jgi:ribonuclease Z